MLLLANPGPVSQPHPYLPGAPGRLLLARLARNGRLKVTAGEGEPALWSCFNIHDTDGDLIYCFAR